MSSIKIASSDIKTLRCAGEPGRACVPGKYRLEGVLDGGDRWLLMEHDGLARRIDVSLSPVRRREGSDLELEGEVGCARHCLELSLEKFTM